MSDDEHLWLHNCSIDAQSRADRESSGLARAILALSDDVVVDTLYRHSDERDSHSLDHGRPHEAELLRDAPDDLRRDLEVILVLPRLASVDEGARNVLGVLVLHDFRDLLGVIGKCFVLGTDVFLFFGLLFLLGLGCGSTLYFFWLR